ncbi:hypothetical protein QE152_g3452 [Popillia japonica]|uniref:Uncharacterized protein n=1 Tax=Popillia japonica TaxID=7064 RepID=A0AAW1N393_POPJA
MSSDINVSVDYFLSMPFVGQWATHPFYMHVFMGISTTAILNRPSKPCLSPNYSNVCLKRSKGVQDNCEIFLCYMLVC